MFLHLQSTQIHAWMSGIGNPRYCLLCEQLDLALLVWLRLANLNKEKFSKNFCPDLQWVSCRSLVQSRRRNFESNCKPTSEITYKQPHPDVFLPMSVLFSCRLLYIGFLEMLSNLSKIQSSTKVKVNPLIYVDISCPSQWRLPTEWRKIRLESALRE